MRFAKRSFAYRLLFPLVSFFVSKHGFTRFYASIVYRSRCSNSDTVYSLTLKLHYLELYKAVRTDTSPSLRSSIASEYASFVLLARFRRLYLAYGV